MVSGCSKKIYYVKDTKSSVFGEAYFILRPGAELAAGDCDLAAEADRILREKLPRRKRRTVSRGGAFLIGALCGVMAATIAALLL